MTANKTRPADLQGRICGQCRHTVVYCECLLYTTTYIFEDATGNLRLR